MLIKKHISNYFSRKLLFLIEVFDDHGVRLAHYYNEEKDSADAVENFLDLLINNGIIKPSSVKIEEIEFKRKK